MGADAKTTMKSVELSDAAAKRIAYIVAKEPGKTALRVAVEGAERARKLELYFKTGSGKAVALKRFVR